MPEARFTFRHALPRCPASYFAARPAFQVLRLIVYQGRSMSIGTIVRESKGPGRTNDWLLQRALRNGVLLGIPLLFGSLILSLWLYEKTGHTDRSAADSWCALALDAEERFASHQLMAANSQYEFQPKSGAIRTNSNGIHIDGHHFPWSDVMGATRTKGILVITIKNGPVIKFGRNDGADFALFAKVFSRAGVAVEVRPPLEPCWQSSDVSVSDFGLPSERIA